MALVGVDAEVQQHADAAVLDEVRRGAEAAAAEDGDARRRGCDRTLLVLRGREVRDGVLAGLQARAGALGDLRRRSLRRCRRRGGTAGGGPARDGGGRLQQERVALGRRLQPRPRRPPRRAAPRAAGRPPSSARRAGARPPCARGWSPRGTPSARPPPLRAPARQRGRGPRRSALPRGPRCERPRPPPRARRPALFVASRRASVAPSGPAAMRASSSATRFFSFWCSDVSSLRVWRCASRSSRSLRSFSSAFSCRRVRSAASRSRSLRRRSSSSACSSPSAAALSASQASSSAGSGSSSADSTKRFTAGSALDTGVPLTSMDSATRSMPLWPTSSSSGSSSSDGARTPPTWSTTRSRPSCQTNGVRRASCGKESSPSASPSFRRASSGTHGGAFRACGDRRFARWAIIERYPGSSHRRGVGATGNSGTVARMSQELTWA